MTGEDRPAPERAPGKGETLLRDTGVCDPGPRAFPGDEKGDAVSEKEPLAASEVFGRSQAAADAASSDGSRTAGGWMTNRQRPLPMA